MVLPSWAADTEKHDLQSHRSVESMGYEISGEIKTLTLVQSSWLEQGLVIAPRSAVPGSPEVYCSTIAIN